MSEFLRITERYQLDKLIHASDTANVFRATDTRRGRTVAVKLLRHGPDAAPEGRSRFEAAAEALRGCRHPVLPALLDHGWSAGGGAYLVFEYLSGADFDLLAGSPPARMMPLLVPALGALEELERHHLAHRNVRSANLLVVPGAGAEQAERVKLLGWSSFTWGTGEPGRRADLSGFARLVCAALGGTIEEGAPAFVDLPAAAAERVADPTALTMLLSLLLEPSGPAPASLLGELRRALGPLSSVPEAQEAGSGTPPDAEAAGVPGSPSDEQRALRADVTMAVPRDVLLAGTGAPDAGRPAVHSKTRPSFVPGDLVRPATAAALLAAPAAAATPVPAAPGLDDTRPALTWPQGDRLPAGPSGDRISAGPPGDAAGAAVTSSAESQAPAGAPGPPAEIPNLGSLPEPSTVRQDEPAAGQMAAPGGAVAGLDALPENAAAGHGAAASRPEPVPAHSEPGAAVAPAVADLADGEVSNGSGAALSAGRPALPAAAPATVPPSPLPASAAPAASSPPGAPAAVASTPSPPPGRPAPAARRLAGGRGDRSRRVAALVGGAALALLALGVLVTSPRWRGARGPRPAGTQDGRSAGSAGTAGGAGAPAGGGAATGIAARAGGIPLATAVAGQPAAGTPAAGPPAAAASPAAPLDPRLKTAQELLLAGDEAGARRALGQIPAEQRAALGPADRESLDQLTVALAADSRARIAADLTAGQRRGDIRRLAEAVNAARRETGLPAAMRRDLDRARLAVDLDARLAQAEKAQNAPDMLRQATDLLALVPRAARAGELRAAAAKTLEEQADAALAAGDTDRAAALAGLLRQAWPDRAGLQERTDRIEAQRRTDERLEGALAAAGRAEAAGQPLQGLETLAAVGGGAGGGPGGLSPRFRDRFQKQRERLSQLLARLDAAPPAIALRAGYKLEFDKGERIAVPLRITDDLAVKAAECWVRPEGTASYQAVPVRHLGGADYEADIPPELHQNRPLEIYATATDNSGHQSSLGSRDRPLKLKRRNWLEKIFTGKEKTGTER